MTTKRTIFEGRGQREAALAVEEARTTARKRRGSNGAVVAINVELFDFIFRSLLLEAAASGDGDIITDRGARRALSRARAVSSRDAQASSRATLQG